MEKECVVWLVLECRDTWGGWRHQGRGMWCARSVGKRCHLLIILSVHDPFHLHDPFYACA